MIRSRTFLVPLVLLLLLPAGVVLAQTGSGITSPRDNTVVQGVVLIEGTALHPDFLRYEIAFFREYDPLGDWVVFATGNEPVVNGILAAWDTQVGRDAGAPFYPDGTYRLRLRLVRTDSNYDEYYVLGISVANDEPTPTPTVDREASDTPTAAPTVALIIPTELPTLTPFPTVTPRPTAEQQEGVQEETETPESGGGLLQFEGEFDSGQVRSGLLLGVRVTLGFFLALGLYLGLRRVLRWGLARIRSVEFPSRTKPEADDQ